MSSALGEIWRHILTAPSAQLGAASLHEMIDQLRVLRVHLRFDEPDELAQSFNALSGLLKRVTPAVTLLRVHYTPRSLTSEARATHEAFREAHPEVSTYLPLCLPPSPLGELSRWATPDQCATCIFREGERCGGLGDAADLSHDEASDPPLRGSTALREHSGGALNATWSIELHDQRTLEPPINLFTASQPLSYWWPQASRLRLITDALSELKVKRLWDIGGGNGYLAWLIHMASQRHNDQLIEMTCVDPVATHYPSYPQVTQRAESAEQTLIAVRRGELSPPDALLISWPSPGRSYAQVIDELKPRLIIRATDSLGVCGVRRGHYTLEIDHKRSRWYELTESRLSTSSESPSNIPWDDLDPPSGYEVRDSVSVLTYRDLRTDQRSTASSRARGSGRLMLFQRQS